MLTALLLACSVVVALQPAPAPATIDGDALRSMAIEAVAGAKGNPAAALRTLDAGVRARWGDVVVEPLSISDAPTEIRLFSPYAAYRRTIGELLKRNQPIDRLSFDPVGIVTVAPARVDAPDVTGVILRRDGVDVRPSASALVPRPISSPMGVTLNLHAGYVAFPLAAFAPGADVTVVAVLESGSPLTLTLDAATLSRFR